MINEIIKKRNMSKYKLAKTAKIPYMTINDLCSGKTKLNKCNAETVYRLAQALGVQMEDLLAPYVADRCSTFDNFKSSICHRVKEMGDLPFIIDIYEKNTIRTYYDWHWYPECYYLLGMVDYLSRINHFPVCSDYNDIRQYKLEQPIFPASLRASAIITNDKSLLVNAKQNAIPEFLRFNIIENEVRDIV